MNNPIRMLLVALLVVPALAILAFGPRSGEAEHPGMVVVDYWEKWTAAEQEQMQKIVDDFNNGPGKEKHIFVRYVSTSGIGTKTLLATAAGVPPDIAGMWDGNIVQYASQSAIIPLEDLAREHGITADRYKPIYWNGCNYNGHLYALVSTPAAVALHYNKKTFQEKAAQLRAAGLDPDRPPRTLDELDAYAKVLDDIGPDGRIHRSGYLPADPGWYLNDTCYWFGGDIWNPRTHKFTLTDPNVVRAYEWIQSYSRRLGKNATTEFTSGLGNFDSPQNSFLSGTEAMEMQGPWMANYIYNLKPSMSTVLWDREKEMTQPPAERVKNYQWAAAPFPSAVPGLENVTFCSFDTFCIPRGARHVKEAFEFMAFVNTQAEMEKLCMAHCKNSPLAKVSDYFFNHHPNPYIKVFEELATSPNAHTLPQIPIYPQVAKELASITQSIILLNVSPKVALAGAQERLQAQYDHYAEVQAARGNVPP